jgi:glycosyltransferase involved in cell wall biosynthesis
MNVPEEATPESRPKVLFLRTDACTVEPRIRKEAASLVRAGFDVQAFGWDRKREYAKAETFDGVRYFRTRIPGPYGSKLLALVLPLFWVRVMIRLGGVRPDIVHACDLDGLIPALALRPLLRYRVVYDIFDHFAFKIGGVPARVRRLIQTFDRSLMKRADALIVADRHRLSLTEGAQPAKVEIVMNVPPRRPVAPAPGKGNGVRLCQAGAIHEHRGLYHIAEALRQLDRIEVVFAGWITREQDRKFLESQSWIRYVGKLPYEEALRLLDESDVSLALFDPRLPINAMASSNKVFEAMAAGRPIITNAETTMAEIVREADCGLLVPYGNARALREAVCRLRDHPEERARLAQNGRRAFEADYTWESMEDRLVHLYQGLRTRRAHRSTHRPHR